jgi:hypothetical protein
MWPTLDSLRLVTSNLTPRKARSRCRPLLETLEDRTVPSAAGLAD